MAVGDDKWAKQFSQKELPLEFAVGSIRGVRSFGLDNLGRLKGVQTSLKWTPGENVSTCQAEDSGTGLERIVKAWKKARRENLRYRSLMLGTDYYKNKDHYENLRWWLKGIDDIPPIRTMTRDTMGEPEVVSTEHVKTGLFAWEERPVYGEPKKIIEYVPVSVEQDNIDLQEWVSQQPKEPVEHDFADCHCGFYGFFDGSDDYSNVEGGKYQEYAPVSAVIEAYGETLIGERGFRASKAKIIAVRLDPNHLSVMDIRRIKRNYPDVAVFNDMNSMLEIYPPSDELGITPDNTEDFWTRKA